MVKEIIKISCVLSDFIALEKFEEEQTDENGLKKCFTLINNTYKKFFRHFIVAYKSQGLYRADFLKAFLVSISNFCVCNACWRCRVWDQNEPFLQILKDFSISVT